MKNTISFALLIGLLFLSIKQTVAGEKRQSITNTAACPTGYTNEPSGTHSNLCYKHLAALKVSTGENASISCATDYPGATLPIFRSLSEYVSYSMWWRAYASGSMTCDIKSFIGLKWNTTTSNFSYIDGTPVTFSMWGASHPATPTYSMYALHYAPGAYWYTNTADTPEVFCQVRLSEISALNAFYPTSSRCPDTVNWAYDKFSDLCYYKQFPTKNTWNNSQTTCLSFGGHLPVFCNASEWNSFQTFQQIYQLPCTDIYHWIGYYKCGTDWVTYNGLKSTYLPWGIEYPSQSPEKDYIGITMYRSPKFWNNYGSAAYDFTCQYRPTGMCPNLTPTTCYMSSTTTTTTTTMVTTPAYQEYTAPRHGRNMGIEYTAICPTNGVITGMDVFYSSRINFLKWYCTSSEGKTSIGPYGAISGTYYSLHCPTGSYISSIYGRNGRNIDQLGIRCRQSGDLINQGTKYGHVGGSGGGNFDDLSYSIGFRPVEIKVKAESKIYSIQITYGNKPVTLCQNCSKYQEEWAPVHGQDHSKSILNTFVCPNDGVITGIDGIYGKRVDQIKFTCTSVLGKTIFGPYGGNYGGTAFSDHCPAGYYTGAIHGRQGFYLEKIGIRCVKHTQPNGLKRDGWGTNNGVEFDDQQIVRNKRPVEVRIRTWWYVDGIQIKYGNLPVNLDCQITKIQVMEENVPAQHEGLELIGLKSAFTCVPGTAQLLLQATQTRDETTGVEIMEGGDINWSTSISVSYTYGFGVGVSSEISIDLTQTIGGSTSWSNTKSSSVSIGSQNQQGVQFPFEGPGASLAVGYVNRYRIERDNVPVLYHSTCVEGALQPQPGKIKLTSKTFADVKTQNFAFKFNSTEKCTDEIRSCVSALRVGLSFSDPLFLRKQFNACFPPTSGTAYRK